MQALKNDPTLPEMQTHISDFCKEKGWDKNSITEIYLLFSEESGELAKAIRKTTGFKGESTKNARENLEGEFADVFMYLMDLANYFDIDLETAYRKKIDINKNRTWS